MQTAAYAAAAAGSPLAPTMIERREPREHDVLIDIAFSGICHSDIHQARGEWGRDLFPMVPGHEIAGTVAAVGPGVTTFAVGDRVGVGVLVDSCRECGNCQRGMEQHCAEGMIDTYNAIGRDGEVTQGGYARQIVTDERFVHRIPDSLPLDQAAPLLCAGITVYAPLRRWGAGPGVEVGVIGMGGLGHLAVKLAHAMGARVTVISHTLAKQADGARLGADAYVAASEPGALKALRNSLDLIICTVSAETDMNRYLGLLRTHGVLVNVGLPVEPLTVSAFALIGGDRALAGSAIGGVPQTQEMLDFCAEHGIVADVEVIDIADINAAWKRIKASDVRYRFVIDIAGTLA